MGKGWFLPAYSSVVADISDGVKCTESYVFLFPISLHMDLQFWIIWLKHEYTVR
jgi:hypothetical protein